MPFTALSDNQIKYLLENLSLEELQECRRVLAHALHDFSTNTNVGANGPYQQPHRLTTKHPDSKATSLYMPSCGPEGMGCKIVSLTTHDDESAPNIQPTGIVNILSPTGQPLGLLHASTLTAFRTALASACLLFKRGRVHTITVFGAGQQAYWHVRLALMLRGQSIRKIHVVNRSFSDHAGQLMKRFALVPQEVKHREGWDGAEFSMLTPAFHDYERLLTENVLAADIIYCCTPSTEVLFNGEILTSHEGRRKGRLIVAVGSFTPEMRELPEELLVQATKHHEKGHRHFHKHADEGGVVVVDTLEGALKEAGEIISAKIGPQQLVELGELVMLHRIRAEESETDTLHSQTSTESDKRSSSIDTSSTTPAMSSVYGHSSNGDGTSSPRSPSPSGSRSSFHLPFRKRSGSPASAEKKKREDKLATWLRDGTVVYKSVGLGLMDLVVGGHIIKLAEEKGIGTQIPDF